MSRHFFLVCINIIILHLCVGPQILIIFCDNYLLKSAEGNEKPLPSPSIVITVISETRGKQLITFTYIRFLELLILKTWLFKKKKKLAIKLFNIKNEFKILKIFMVTTNGEAIRIGLNLVDHLLVVSSSLP